MSGLNHKISDFSLAHSNPLSQSCVSLAHTEPTTTILSRQSTALSLAVFFHGCQKHISPCCPLQMKT
jgi:hypothetical protein